MHAYTRYLLLVLLIAIGSNVNAQPTDSNRLRSNVQPKTEAPTVTTLSDSARSLQAQQTEMAVLTARLEEERAHNSAVLQTVYWALGVFVTMSVVLISFGWFVNFRVYERDKDALAKTLDGNLQTQVASARESFLHGMEEMRQNIVRETDRMRTESTTYIDQSISKHLAEISTKLDMVQRSLKENQLDLEILNADYLFDKRQNGNAFTACINAIYIARDLRRPGTIDSVLNTIEKQVSRMDGMFSTDVSKLLQILDQIKNGPLQFFMVNQVQVQRLENLLGTVRKLDPGRPV